MTTQNEIPYFEDAESALMPNLPAVERDAINAIVYNPTKDEVLCLDWVKFGWKTFIIGGIEKGEDAVTAALREILEEAGYKDIRFVADLGKTRSGYYAAHKGENRISNATGLLFELVSEVKDEVEHPENLPHVFRWVPRTEVSSYLTLSSQKYIWEKAQATIARA
jgi:8-oxo-dGTP pyrophosphatase MutT (NUDIX family)